MIDPFIRRIQREPTGSGVLSGLRFAAKDMFDIAGEVSGFGSPDWLRTHGPCAADCPVIEALLGAGARLEGMTHMEELAFSLTGENAHYGTPLNPAAPDRIPGGSSSGSASAVASGLVDFALGTDTGGSVRIPASYCGVIGIRTTHGLIDSRGVIPMARSFDSVGWFAREMPIMSRVAEVLLPQMSAGARRLIVVDDAFELSPVDPAHWRDALDKTAGVYGSEHVRLTDEGGLGSWAGAFRVLQGAEAWAEHGGWIEAERPELGSAIARRFEYARRVDAASLSYAETIRAHARGRVLELVREGGVLCLPTAPGPAPLRGESGEATELHRERTMQLTCIAGLSGVPQVSIPVGRVDGAPIGLSLIGAPGADGELLAMAEEVMLRLGRGASTA